MYTAAGDRSGKPRLTVPSVDAARRPTRGWSYGSPHTMTPHSRKEKTSGRWGA